MIRLIFFLFILFVGLAIFVFPWYVTLGLVVVLVFSLKFLIRYLFMLPFMAKGKVLDGAKFDVHSITLVPDPNPERTAENEAAAAEYGEKSDPKVFYAIDVTISPKAATGSFKLWDPSEMLLVKPDAKARDLEGDDELGSVFKIERFENGAFVDDSDGDKLEGSQRLKLTFSAPPDAKQAKVRYYFTLLGPVNLGQIGVN
jgi:hypothetical protein